MRTVLAGLLAVGVALWPAAASVAEPGPAPANWPAADRETLADIESYLNDLTSLRARFTQINADGSEDHGVLWLDRPGRARVEYAPPTDVLVVADGTWLIYYDAELDQVSHVPIDTGPFRFLLDARVRLGGDVAATAFERRAGLVGVTLVDAEAPDEGAVTLLFDAAPLKLRQWQVRDAQGFVTIVTLADQVAGQPYDRDLFTFNDRRRTRDFRKGEHD